MMAHLRRLCLINFRVSCYWDACESKETQSVSLSSAVNRYLFTFILKINRWKATNYSSSSSTLENRLFISKKKSKNCDGTLIVAKRKLLQSRRFTEQFSISKKTTRDAALKSRCNIQRSYLLVIVVLQHTFICITSKIETMFSIDISKRKRTKFANTRVYYLCNDTIELLINLLPFSNRTALLVHAVRKFRVIKKLWLRKKVIIHGEMTLSQHNYISTYWQLHRSEDWT